METITVSNIEIEVEHKDIMHIHLSVYPPDGRVHVSVPMKMTIDSVRLYAITKMVWIKGSIKKVLSQERQTPREYVSGESHYFKGRRYVLRVNYVDEPPYVNVLCNKFIQLNIRPESTLNKRAEVMMEWYRKELKSLLDTYIINWQKKMNVECNGWEVKHMKTKWGSCNHMTKHILFNLELAKKPTHCIEYVVVHELAHILVRTHDSEFKKILDIYMPQWEIYKRKLNEFII